MVAQSLSRTLTEAARAAVQASDWERDQESWNLPRAPGVPIVSAPDQDGRNAGEGDPYEPGAEPPAISPETTE